MDRFRQVRWPLVVLPAILVGGFEYIRHALLDSIPALWGNLIAAAIAAVGSLIYYLYTLSVIERLNESLHAEQAHKALMDERERIAGRLHDSLAQTLFFLNAELDRAVSHLERGEPREALAPLAAAKEGIAFAHEDLRDTIEALQNTEWDKPLLPSLRNLATAFYRQSGMTVEVTAPDTLPDLVPETRLAVFRVAQEALNNVRKHARATRATLSLVRREECLELSVIDDGVGIGPDELRPGFGMTEMERLAKSVDGRLSVTRREEGGTRVELRIPLSRCLRTGGAAS